jgi:hypothetical protein
VSQLALPLAPPAAPKEPEPPQPTTCRCILRLSPSVRERRGHWHTRGCPLYEPPPLELMARAFEMRDAWLFRHWPHKRYPRAEDFRPATTAAPNNEEKRDNDDE